MAAVRIIRRATGGAVADVAATAACEHAYALVRAHGEASRDGATGLAHGGRADLRHFDRDARLGAAESTGSCPSEVAAGTADRRNACRQPAPGPGDDLAGPQWPHGRRSHYELLTMIISSTAGPPEQSAHPPARRTTRGMRVHTLPIRSCAICHGLCRGKDTPPHCEIQPLLHRPGMLGNGLAFGHRRTSDNVMTRRNGVHIVTYFTPDACMRA